MPLRKTTRSTAGIPPKRFCDEYGELTNLADHCAFSMMDTYEPRTFQEAMESPNAQKWWDASQAEYNSLIENETWELVPLPEGRKKVSCKWVFKVKRDKDGNIDRYKGHLVVRGFSQEGGVDYFETFSPVVRLDSICALLAFAVQQAMNIHQMDVVTAFLNGHLEEEIYMEQPEGFIESGKEHLVCRLKCSLYGLKQAARCWNQELDEFLLSNNFIQSVADPCIYFRDVEKNSIAILAVYVDDIVLFTKTEEEMVQQKDLLSTRFKMKDMGPLHYILGIHVEQKDGTLQLHQRSFIVNLLEKFGMQECKPTSTPITDRMMDSANLLSQRNTRPWLEVFSTWQLQPVQTSHFQWELSQSLTVVQMNLI